MAILKKEFHYHDRNGDEDWYYIARDSESGKVWIQHERQHRGVPAEINDMNIADFLTAPIQGTRQTKFLELIGTLATEEE